MRYGIILTVVLGLLAAGCGETAPPAPPPSETPPDKSPDEYYKEIRGALPDVQGLGAMSEEMILANIPAATQQLQGAAGGGTENKNKALERVAEDLLNAARQFKDQEKWAAVKAACELRKVLNPDTSQTERMMTRAEQVLARPKITVKGFMEVGTQLFVLLEARSLQTGATGSYRIQEGEEFGQEMGANLKMTRIIGNREAIEVLDLKTNDSWEVEGPVDDTAAEVAAQAAAAAAAMQAQPGGQQAPAGGGGGGGRGGRHGGDDEEE